MKEATTEDLKKGIKQMETEGLNLKARVEIYLKGKFNGNKRYGIIAISHFHNIPNLTLEIDEIKDNLVK